MLQITYLKKQLMDGLNFGLVLGSYQKHSIDRFVVVVLKIHGGF
jgi:hypothetical protein